MRFATTLTALVLIPASGVERGAPMIGWAVVVVSYNVFRLVRPLESGEDTVSVVQVVFEVALHAIAAAFTGAWDSPFVFPLLPAIMVAGFGRGIWPALRIGFATAVAVSTVEIVRNPGLPGVWVNNVRWTLFLALVGVMAGYARRTVGEARTTHTLAMSRVASLTDANQLLTSLHAVAQALPASLDLDEVLDSIVARLRALFTYDAAVLLLLDDTDGSWQVARWDGHRLSGALEPTQLPGVLRKVQLDRTVRRIADLSVHGGGLLPKMASGLYGPLIARGEFVGLVALEALPENLYGGSDSDLLQGFLEQAALAISNAQVFERLRTVGADEERTRIARDLHDRIGQSLAYVAFELDRMVKAHEDGRDLGPSLVQLRNDVRGVIGEVRDTLYALRTDVSEDHDFVATMHEFLERVEKRSGLRVMLKADAPVRLTILPEREFWRIAQEAVINVERHAQATTVAVLWRTDGNSAVLEVVDDGVGLPEGRAGRLDSYGIMGMRERAASIGATLQVTSPPGRGTVVRCRLDAR
ncbi:MAG: GAF domain-containing protein [Actinobacteria bacterium]|nr:GAF domain-containing protein [Actinomycetota bacterium]